MRKAGEAVLPTDVGSGPIEGGSPDPTQGEKIKMVQDYLSTHPGLTFQQAMLHVKQDRPDLFPEAAPDRIKTTATNQDKMEQVKAEIERMQAAHPNRSFETCWHLLEQEKPELFGFAQTK